MELDMEFTSTSEILSFAISKEEASVQFYRDLMSQSLDPKTRSLFEVLLRNEQEHAEALRLEMNKLGYTVSVTGKKFSHAFLWNEELEANDQLRNMSFVDGLLLAIQKERAAFRLYVQILAMVQGEAFSKILMELAEEEMRHVLQLEQEYESIVRSEK